jgi:hypothetical protein
LAEVGVFDARLQVRLYTADFSSEFHDVRARRSEYEPLHDPSSYTASQQFAKELMDEGSNGVVYRSVRHATGECLACFRPKLVKNVRPAGFWEYRWRGQREPRIVKLRARERA